MAHLRFTAVSDDGAHLRLVDEEGAEHLLAIDDRLRAAVRPSTAPASPDGRGMEKTMESTLRPRDIQSRIRAGETPEAVAEAARTSVDKIMAFAAPVLAERQHVAERAQRSSVRRGDGAQASHGARTLGDAVGARLRSLNVDPETITWDAWRREDGRWTLIGEFASAERSGTAELSYDAPGNYVTLENDEARWLVGEAVAAAPVPTDDLQAARQRRLTGGEPATEDVLPLGDLGDDAIDLVSDQPVEAFLDPEPITDPEVAAHEAELNEEVAAAVADDPEPVAEPEDDDHEAPTRRPVKKTRGRASVPSWDEIMFGGGDRG